MWAVLLLVVALAQNQTACSTSSPGNPSGQQVQLGYRYDFAMSVHLSFDYVYFFVQSDVDISAYQLWFYSDTDSVTALSASLYPRVSVEYAANSSSSGTPFNDPTASLDLHSVALILDLSTLVFPSNGTNAIFISFFPSCDACYSTIEFSLELALLTSVPTGSSLSYPNTFAPIPLVQNLRSFEWGATQGQWLQFVAEIPANTSIYSSVTTSGEAGQTVLYFQMGMPPNTSCIPFCQMYPNQQTTVTGSYVVSTPFVTTAAGVYYLGLYLKESATLETYTTVTVKVAYGTYPCAPASTQSISILAILATLALAASL